VVRGWRRLHSEELRAFTLLRILKGDKIKDDEMGGVCRMCRRDEKCRKHFFLEILREETSRNNIRTNLLVNWIHLAEDRDK